MEYITANTKISELIKQNSDSIRAIASLAKPLEKLQNPILRKIMASRVTIAEAAKMGGTTVAEFQRVLRPLGFSFREDAAQETNKDEIKPVWLSSANDGDIEWYDVRPIIDEGADPLKEILHRFKDVPSGKILCVINSFVPTPLIHLLKQEKAEDAFVETINEKEFRTYFLKKEKNAESVPAQKLNMDDVQTFERISAQFTDKITEMDVRALEMPGPMHAILGALETLEADSALYIHHKRVPVYLLEELADKDFEVHICEYEENNVKMLIFKR